MKTITFIAAFLLGIAGLFAAGKPVQSAELNSFEECAAAGYSVTESQPRQCTAPDGRSFIETAPPDALVPEKPSNDSMVACTMEAKQCPDGSYVSRVAPDCEFAPCPGEKAQ